MIDVIVMAYIWWSLIGIVIYSIVINTSTKCALTYYGPIFMYLRKKTKMNYIGCGLVAIIYYITYPLLFIGRSVIMTVYWLLHVGRKDVD